MCLMSVVIESVESLVTVLQACSGAAVMDRQSHAVFSLLPSCQTFCENQSMLASWYFVAPSFPPSLPPSFPPSVSLHSHSSPEFQTAVLSLLPPPSVIFFYPNSATCISERMNLTFRALPTVWVQLFVWILDMFLRWWVLSTHSGVSQLQHSKLVLQIKWKWCGCSRLCTTPPVMW